MITYAYERVSSKDQNLERQETAIKKFRPDIPDANIFRDKVTGKINISSPVSDIVFKRFRKYNVSRKPE